MNYTYTGPCDFDDSAAPLAGNLLFPQMLE